MQPQVRVMIRHFTARWGAAQQQPPPARDVPRAAGRRSRATGWRAAAHQGRTLKELTMFSDHQRRRASASPPSKAAWRTAPRRGTPRGRWLDHLRHGLRRGARGRTPGAAVRRRDGAGSPPPRSRCCRTPNSISSNSSRGSMASSSCLRPCRQRRRRRAAAAAAVAAAAVAEPAAVLRAAGERA